MTVLVKKEWLKTCGRSQRLERARPSVDWRSTRRWAWVVTLIFAAVFFLAWQNIEMKRAGYEIEKLKERLETLQAQNSLLTVEAASLEDLYVIERRAEHELGMTKPAPGQVVRLDLPAGEQGKVEKEAAQDGDTGR